MRNLGLCDNDRDGQVPSEEVGGTIREGSNRSAFANGRCVPNRNATKGSCGRADAEASTASSFEETEVWCWHGP